MRMVGAKCGIAPPRRSTRMAATKSTTENQLRQDAANPGLQSRDKAVAEYSQMRATAAPVMARPCKSGARDGLRFKDAGSALKKGVSLKTRSVPVVSAYDHDIWRFVRRQPNERRCHLPSDIRACFARLPTTGKALVLARLIHADTVHARDAYVPGEDAADGVRLREHNESVHRLSGVLMAVLGERMSADHHDYMVGLIELIVSPSQRRREELARWIAEAARQ